jgi:hypothetical protein
MLEVEVEKSLKVEVIFFKKSKVEVKKILRLEPHWMESTASEELK